MKPKGFSLIEVLVAIALLGIMAIAAGSIYSSIMRAQRQSASINEVQLQGTYALYQITQTIRNGRALSTVTASSTTIIMPGGSSVVIASSGTTITIKTGSGNALPITSDDVQISNFTLTALTPNGSKGVLRITFTVSATNPLGLSAQMYSQKFYATVTLR